MKEYAMAWSNGASRTSTAKWKRLYRQAKREIPMVCAVTGMTNEDLAEVGERLELNHIVPVAEGGLDEISNLQWLSTGAHAAESHAQWERGQQRRRKRRYLPEETHPGLR